MNPDEPLKRPTADANANRCHHRLRTPAASGADRYPVRASGRETQVVGGTAIWVPERGKGPVELTLSWLGRWRCRTGVSRGRWGNWANACHRQDPDERNPEKPELGDVSSCKGLPDYEADTLAEADHGGTPSGGLAGSVPERLSASTSSSGNWHAFGSLFTRYRISIGCHGNGLIPFQAQPYDLGSSNLYVNAWNRLGRFRPDRRKSRVSAGEE